MELSWEFPQLYSLLVVLLGSYLHVSVSGQNLSLIATPMVQTDLVSPGWTFNLDYGPNVTYDYLLTTNYVNHTIQVNVSDCEIEADKNGDCLYDVLKFYDGPDNNSLEIKPEFCCATKSGSWLSTGSQMYLRFETDGTNNFKGFQLKYMSFGWTSTTPPPTSPTTTRPSTASTAPAGGSTEDSSNNSLYIIIGCAAGGLILLILLILLIGYCLKKNNRPASPDSPRDTKRVLWSRNSLWNSRSNTVVQPFQASPRHLPPGTVTQTNIFEMDLPDHGRGNQLPPLESKLSLPGPTVVAPPIGKSL